MIEMPCDCAEQCRVRVFTANAALLYYNGVSSQNLLYTLTTALCNVLKKNLYILKRVVYNLKRALYNLEKAQYSYVESCVAPQNRPGASCVHVS